MKKNVYLLFVICSISVFSVSCNNTDAQVDSRSVSTDVSTLHVETEMPTIDTEIAEKTGAETETSGTNSSENTVQYSQYSELEALLRDLSENISD